jgi:hypothetical protein
MVQGGIEGASFEDVVEADKSRGTTSIFAKTDRERANLILHCSRSRSDNGAGASTFRHRGCPS